MCFMFYRMMSEMEKKKTLDFAKDVEIEECQHGRKAIKSSIENIHENQKPTQGRHKCAISTSFAKSKAFSPSLIPFDMHIKHICAFLNLLGPGRCLGPVGRARALGWSLFACWTLRFMSCRLPISFDIRGACRGNRPGHPLSRVWGCWWWCAIYSTLEMWVGKPLGAGLKPDAVKFLPNLRPLVPPG